MIDITVRPDDGEEYQVTATSRDILIWERTNRKGLIFADLMERLALDNLYWLAWITSRRLGLYGGTKQEFEDTHQITFEVEEGAEDRKTPDPTPKAPSAARTSRSLSSPASRSRSGPRKTTAH